jgi:hypothetical protein
MRERFRIGGRAVLRIAVALLCAGAAGACRRSGEVALKAVPLKLDLEERLTKEPLSASTQSVNRYRSVLQQFDGVEVKVDHNGRLRLQFDKGHGASDQLSLENIDFRFLVPLLDYPHAAKLTPFDRANLMLAEYSRSGVELALEDQNSTYGYFASRGLFNEDEEYTFVDGKVVPNPGARPKRMALTNNCLAPGLWEVSAQDSVGEMYHGWTQLPEHGYFELVRQANALTASDEELKDALTYRPQLGGIQVELDRVRERVRPLGAFPATVNLDKPIASYSTQDSRRKVQRRFFTIERAGETITPKTFGDLQPGDVFVCHSFIPPGVYSSKEARRVVYAPIWSEVELSEVKPKTRYAGPSPHAYPFGAIELTLRSKDQRHALVVGNLPVDLLVFQEDYDVPGFGVGVLRASETIEKRHLFFKDGPAPVYAYLLDAAAEGGYVIANNHEAGLEQVYLRPFRRGDQVLLRITLVAYERIVDLLELEVPLPEELQQRLRDASATYRRPLWRSFSDSNLL